MAVLRQTMDTRRGRKLETASPGHSSVVAWTGWWQRGDSEGGTTGRADRVRFWPRKVELLLRCFRRLWLAGSEPGLRNSAVEEKPVAPRQCCFLRQPLMSVTGKRAWSVSQNHADLERQKFAASAGTPWEEK